ncbi:hypothetical protein LV779_08995 [Streptomyces thinghirensis]|nr:hypothetical protein [Streptomyces thinghirensis]
MAGVTPGLPRPQPTFPSAAVSWGTRRRERPPPAFRRVPRELGLVPRPGTITIPQGEDMGRPGDLLSST